MAKLVDASASKAGVEKRVGPSPTFGTNQPPLLGNDCCLKNKNGGLTALLKFYKSELCENLNINSGQFLEIYKKI